MTIENSSSPDNTDLPIEVVAALQRGKKIEAIKLLREARQLDLKEAKEQVEAFERNYSGTFKAEVIDLPGEVVANLQRGKKIEAIKLLRDAQQIGLKAAKQQVEAYLAEHPEISPAVSKKSLLLTVVLLVSFVWVFITSIDAVSNLIVLVNLDGYQIKTFTVGKVRYSPDGEGGLQWGFDGRIGGIDVKLYAPHLADGKELGHARLKKLFPLGTEMTVWYNPEVTDTLFQGRTLQLIPYTPSLKMSELKHFLWWLSCCLLPFLLILLLARWRDRIKLEA